jgi:hypothetical protein
VPRTGLIALAATVLLGLLLGLDMYLPREARSITGTVLMFQSRADESGIHYLVTVHLDSGEVVHARNPMRLGVALQSRVEVLETTGRLIGTHRYLLRGSIPPLAKIRT